MATADATPPPAATNWRAALPLHAAIAGLDSSTVDRPGPCGATALHLACALGKADAVAALLAAGADPLLLTAPSDPGAYLSSTELKATEVHGYLSSVCKGVLEGRQVDDLARTLWSRACSPVQLAIKCKRCEALARLLAAAPRLPAQPAARQQQQPGSSSSSSSWRLHMSAVKAFLEQRPADVVLLATLLEGGVSPFAAGLLPTIAARCAAVAPSGREGDASAEALRALVRSLGISASAAPPAKLAVLTAGQQLQALHAAVLLSHEEAAILDMIEAQQQRAEQRWEDADRCADIFVEAAAQGMSAALEALLEQRRPDGSHPFHPDMWGDPGQDMPLNALMAAARHNRAAACELLLERGLAANIADEEGAGALHHAVAGGALDAAQLLLQWGASATAQSSVRWGDDGPDHLDRPLLTACARGDLGMVRLLLASGAAGQLSEVTDQGNSCLSVAVCWCHDALLAELLHLGADPNQLRSILPGCDTAQLPPPEALEGTGSFCLYNSPHDYEEMGTLLGAALALSGSAREAQGLRMARLLLAAGADPGLPGNNGQAPLEEMAECGLASGARFLLAEAGHGLEQLGWSRAVRAAMRSLPQARGMTAFAAGLGWALHCAPPRGAVRCLPACLSQEMSEARCLELLLEARGGLAVSPEDCRGIVEALATRTAQIAGWYSGSRGRDAAAASRDAKIIAKLERSATELAEQLASHGISADLTARLGDCHPTCRAVILAAAPADARWSPALCRHYTARFRAAVREVVRCASRQAARRQLRREQAGWEHEPAAAGSEEAPVPPLQPLTSLAPEVLHKILALAAAPVSAWL